ncbi:hypothetical protein [Tenacibaculum soleae]|uniref:hypothetical protein n=1 Tax=Tenacibaculum soleae TaxID=447689 RepID=UPI0026E34578|nr:hypothetical protein [Tenacibaculum soleae]MDO6813815.1 hypothetical protein [Tenacibaculum soleae]
MKKGILLLFLLVSNLIFSQSIYKGLEFEMTPKEAKKEFKKNKNNYISVDLGNNFYYRIYRQNFIFLDKKLSCVVLTPKGFSLGMDYDSARNYLIHTRSFFTDLGYEIFLDNEYWNAPLNYASSGSKWGLILFNKDKTKIIQIFPQKYNTLSTTSFLVNLRIWNYNAWMDLYNKENDLQNNKKANSGF